LVNPVSSNAAFTAPEIAAPSMTAPAAIVPTRLKVFIFALPPYVLAFVPPKGHDTH
jgi:hypothetical protein